MDNQDKKVETEGIIVENIESGSPIELGYLTGVILDYYETTGEVPLGEGDEWKEGTEHDIKRSLDIPEDLDTEIKKAFITQIKKFQK